MNRVVLIVVLVGIAMMSGSIWYLRTCCSPPSPRTVEASATAPRSEPPPVASAFAPAGVTAHKATDSANTGAGATTKRSPRKDAATVVTPAPPVAPAATTTATLRITSDVPGAQVFLNREFVGTAPATAKDLKPGAYQLNVAAPGFDNHVETVELAPGARELVVNFREIRLDLSLDVIHKHRFGSCKGRLIATPQGVRYETADKDDAFTATLLDLETFQVDYLNRNLRIQPRKGKRYDFTDPEGNADRLFVFHRDVDKARVRLRTQ